MQTFDDICGVPVSYDRGDDHSYGTRGKLRTGLGPVTDSFLLALRAWMTELGQLCPWGLPELLVTGGVRGDPHGPPSRHTEGRAIDIDSLWWAGRPALVTREALIYPVAYLAVEVSLRRHFGTVLDYWYDGRHQDHWHVDDGHDIVWSPSFSRVVFLQACLQFVWCKPEVVIDGRVGLITTKAWQETFGGMPFEGTLSLPMAGLVNPQTWKAWLEHTAKHAWSQLAGRP